MSMLKKGMYAIPRQSWLPSEFFAGGANGLWYRLADIDTLYQDTSMTVPVTVDNDPMGAMVDKSGRGNHATQSISSFKPTYTLDPSGAAVLLGDGIDDALLTPPTMFSGTAYINTSYGWYRSFVSEGAAVGLPLTWLKEYIAKEGVASVVDDDKLRNYFATEQKLMIVMSRNLVIKNLRVFSSGSETTVTAIGNNGVTTEKVLSGNFPSSWDLSADGLTAPVLLVFDNNTALTTFTYNINQLTGSIPDLSSNTELTTFYCNTNQLTGSIPDLSSNTKLTNLHCHENQLTGWLGGSVSNSLGNFRADNNALTQSAVDGLLVAFDVAGRATGTRVLNLGGGTNSTPSATGKAAADNLRAKGWTVTLNGY